MPATSPGAVPTEAAAVARLVRVYLTASAVIVALATGLTFLSDDATMMSPAARLVGAGFLLTLQLAGARANWERRILEGRGQLEINALVLALTLVNSVQPMVSGPDAMTSWGIAITVVFAGMVASPAGMFAVVGTVIATSAVAVIRFSSTIEPVVPVTTTVIILVLAWLSAFAGRNFRLGLRASHAANEVLEIRTAQVRQSNEQTIEALRRVDRMKDDFISTVSHELRTPLTVILGLSSTLERGELDLDPETRQMLFQRLGSNAESLHAIISRLLDFGLVAQATGAITDGCNLREATSLALSVTDTDDHQVHVEVGALPLVRGDEVLVGRVIAELLDNAVRHTPAGTAIRVRARQVGDEVEVEVVDRGPGINPAEFGELVHVFGRGGRMETRETRGLGLGLSFCAEVLSHLDSRIQLDDSWTDGARLWFRLATVRSQVPTSPVDAPETTRVPVAPASVATAPPSGPSNA